MNSEYDKQAEKFLTENSLTLSYRVATPQTKPNWYCHGIDYIVTIKNNQTKQKISFHFWDSKRNEDVGNKPTAYDILASLDYIGNDTFQDFCDNFGYDTDSIKALKTYKACLNLTKKLEKVLNSNQIEELQNII